MMNDERILPLRSMARLLGVPQKWLREEAELGKIPHLNADGQLLFVPAAVIEVLVRRAAKLKRQRYGSK